MDALSEKESNFIAHYTKRIQYLMGESPKGMLPYTKLSMAQAIIHYLVEGNVIFHPLSLAYYPSTEREPQPTKEEFVKTLELIIQYEVESERGKCHLTQEELSEAISCFRELTRKLAKVGSS